MRRKQTSISALRRVYMGDQKREDRRQVVKVVFCHTVANAVGTMCSQREHESQGGVEGCNLKQSGQARTH